jgi:hypothetical protein
MPPYKTYKTGAHEIQDAIDAAASGDTVRVTAGIYDINTTIMLKDSLAFVGAGMDSTTLSWQGAQYEDVVLGKAFGYIAGFDINGNCPPSSFVWSGAGIELLNAVQPVEIASCRIHGCNPAVNAAWVTLDIHDCEIISDHGGVHVGPYQLKSIHHNTFYGSSSAVSSHSDADIFSNVFHMYDAGGGIPAIYLKYGWGTMSAHNNLFIEGAGAIDILGPSLMYVYNNTVINIPGYRRGPIGVEFPEWGGNSVVWIVNNVFQDCPTRFVIWGSEYGTCTYHFTYNVIWPPKDTLFEIERLVDLDSIGVIFADPMFSSDSSFYLQAGSPCIDAGDPTILDVDGSRSDIGA